MVQASLDPKKFDLLARNSSRILTSIGIELKTEWSNFCISMHLGVSINIMNVLLLKDEILNTCRDSYRSWKQNGTGSKLFDET
jgi:phage-related protein